MLPEDLLDPKERMNFTRRDVVKGISGAAAMALGAESSLYATESRLSESGLMTSSSDLPWPRMQGHATPFPYVPRPPRNAG